MSLYTGAEYKVSARDLNFTKVIFYEGVKSSGKWLVEELGFLVFKKISQLLPL